MSTEPITVREKALILESDWRTSPATSASQPHAVKTLYASAFQNAACTMRYRPLSAHTFISDCYDFLGLPDNRRGPNLILLSTHGEYSAEGLRHLSATEQVIVLEELLTLLQPHLSRTLLVLDICQVGQALPPLCQQFGLLGVVGFAGRVNWTASSAFILSLLRHWLAADVFNMQRASSRRPAKVLEQMQSGRYTRLMQLLEVNSAWR